MKALLLSGLLLTGTYAALFPSASSGYGYAGYGGYHRGPSWFYIGGPRSYNNNRAIRNSSNGGTSTRGRGPGSGK